MLKKDNLRGGADGVVGDGGTKHYFSGRKGFFLLEVTLTYKMCWRGGHWGPTATGMLMFCFHIPD